MARRSVSRNILLAALILLAVAAVIIVGGILHVRGIKPNYDATVSVAGVQRPVEIWHDSAGVPHIWAQSDEDLYFAQGYAHAQERLWQMELFRRVSEGRLSEIFGESMIDTDRFLRTIGLWRAAALNESRLNADMKQKLGAYANGVNAWIDHHTGSLPPEFVLLRISPEHWTIRNTLAIEKVMAMDLSLYQSAASLTRAELVLGPDQAKYVMPSDPPWGATIVSSPISSTPITQIRTGIPPIPKYAAELLDALSITRASNAWVIGGSRTTSGKPILANDMHLALRQPGVWYLMALHAPDLDVAGMTLPGVPNVIAGHSKAVAWGFTNVMLDDVDFFIERRDPQDTTRYLTPHGSEPFQRINETLAVKGRKDPVRFTIRLTRHGPIISDVERQLKGLDLIAMEWAAADASHSLQAFPAFNRAHNAREFLAAVPYFDNPHQNIVYADTAGHFGYQMGGRIPLRGARMKPPILPVPGWTGQWDWHGYLPFAEQPRIPDPANGYAVTANNRQVRGPLGDLISNDWEMPYRAMRIQQLIVQQPKHNWQTVHSMQLDVTDLLALRYKEWAVRSAQAAGYDTIATELTQWNGLAERSSHAAAHFYAWYESLRRLASQSLFGRERGTIPRYALNAALDSGSFGWLGARGRAGLDSLSRLAMHASDSIARGRTWGELQQVLIEHALGQVSALNKVFDLNVGPAPHRGSPTTVNVAYYTADTFPIVTSYGPSERHVVDMSDVDGVGGFILPSGESGLPGSEHYADMFGRWRNGGLWRIPLDRKAAEARIVHRMVLKPQ